MKLHLELGIIVAMSAMMVFAMTAYVMPSVYAARSGGSSTAGESGASGASGASGVTSKGGHGGKGDNSGSTTTGDGTIGSGSSHPPKNSPSSCVGKCLGTPGYYTTNGHHHCTDGSPGCVCTDPHKCSVGSSSTRPGS
jgi:hypothetical protein